MYVADLPTNTLDPGHTLLFTFYWPDTHRWEGADFSVNIQD